MFLDVAVDCCMTFYCCFLQTLWVRRRHEHVPHGLPRMLSVCRCNDDTKHFGFLLDD